MTFQDIWVAFLSLLDSVSGALLALSFGFFLLPSAIGFIVGGIGSLLTGSVTPISYQQENLALATGLSKDLRPRVSMILGAALLTALLGVFGLPQYIVDTVGQEIFLGMLAGVGLYLTKVGIEIAKEDLIVGVPCAVVAILTMLWTNDLIWSVTASVPLGVVIRLIRGQRKGETAVEIPVPKYASRREALKAEFHVLKPVFSWKVLVGVLAISTLTIGGNIAYTAVNLSMTEGAAQTYNQVTVISGLADVASSAFGGPSMEVIVSATAATPNPVISGAILMFAAAILVLSGLVFKIARFVPLSAMGGYLIVIGLLLVFPYNAMDAFSAGNPMVVALTMGVTLFTNPFYGLATGIVVKILMGLLGVL